MKARNLKIIRRIHKWLMLAVGLQFLFWSLGGLYFSLFDIHFIHGESLVKTPKPFQPDSINYGFQSALRDYPDAKDLKLFPLEGKPYLQFTSQASGKTNKMVIDTTSGQPIKPVSENRARQLATQAFTGSEAISQVNLISKNPPIELSPRYLPVWQVTFDDYAFSTLYISEATGQVVTKRQFWWRAFDVFWRLHILDPFSGEDVNNNLLTVSTILALLTTLAGALLTIILVITPSVRKLREADSSINKAVI